jgi:hypothetical protein
MDSETILLLSAFESGCNSDSCPCTQLYLGNVGLLKAAATTW